TPVKPVSAVRPFSWLTVSSAAAFASIRTTRTFSARRRRTTAAPRLPPAPLITATFPASSGYIVSSRRVRRNTLPGECIRGCQSTKSACADSLLSLSPLPQRGRGGWGVRALLQQRFQPPMKSKGYSRPELKVPSKGNPLVRRNSVFCFGLSLAASLSWGCLALRCTAQQNPIGLAIASTARVKDTFAPLPLRDVQLQGGMLGTRFEA